MSSYGLSDIDVALSNELPVLEQARVVTVTSQAPPAHHSAELLFHYAERQDLGLVRDIDSSRLPFLFGVIRVQLARSEWTLAGGRMCLVGRSRLIKILGRA